MMRVAIAQLNPTVGDVAGNARLLAGAIDQARRDDADLVVGAEMGLVGYPPRDLLFRKGVVEACERRLQTLAEYAGDLVLVVGHPRRSPGGTRPFCNSASICTGGKVLHVYDKRLLPSYDVFDEDRYFEAGSTPCVAEIAGRRLGILICEDLWRARDTTAERNYTVNPVREVAALGCDLLLVLSASPFVPSKSTRHLQQVRAAATKHGMPVVAVHQVGANDDLIFDGRSVVVDAEGSVVSLLPAWEPAVRTVDLRSATAAVDVPEIEPMDDLFHALVLGVRDYWHKTGHHKAVIGLSGGIDSAVTAVVATAALGRDNVIGVMLPSRYSSAASLEDALELAGNLGLPRTETISIEALHEGVHEALAASLGEAGGVTDENIQARVRGVLLMAFANTVDALVLVPSNKSEVATGYSTIYGDTCGALAVLGDVLKTQVYGLAEWINARHGECGFMKPPIPSRSITKAPSAELRPNQTDQDTLPPYDVLDPIVQRYIEREQSIEQIVEETDLDPKLVREITTMIDRAQHKRDQVAPVLKVSPRAFGRGRPMPIAMRWEESSSGLGCDSPTMAAWPSTSCRRSS
ncbi:MAG: NAD+ synthase [Planctomycetota bacterium]|jgi:NAD+ synthetase